jgi:DNA anti-recombination protein RmuC
MPPRSHDHEAGSSSAAPLAIDPDLATILQSLTQQQAHLAAEQARQAAIHQQMSERMLSMFQTIQDRQDTLQQQLLADMAKHRAFMTHILHHTSVQLPPV